MAVDNILISDRFSLPGASTPLSGSQRAYLRLRYILELGVSAILLVLATPVILLAAAIVKLTSPGPAFFQQIRVGRLGKRFNIVKIRSMSHDANRGPQLAAVHDPRVTRFGKFLRATHIDELPQLLNVLRGEMSLIGPRPEQPFFVTKFSDQIPEYPERLAIRPGVTGLAQVQTEADFDEESTRQKLAYDLLYLEALGPWLDLRILCCTVLKMFGVKFHVLQSTFSMPVPASIPASKSNSSSPKAHDAARVAR